MIKKILLWIVLVVVLAIIGGYAYYRLIIYQPPAISITDRAQINLMPLPSKLELKGGKFIINENLNFTFNHYSDESLRKASDRFLKRLSQLTKTKFGNEVHGKNSIIIDCLGGSAKATPQIKEDESYKLNISHNSIVLTATTPIGTFRGLETLLQLVRIEAKESFFPAVEIADTPRFSWRGIMIDVSRHWMPKEVLYRNLDAMAAVKLNVLHLHLSDDQGFRIESKTYPKLHEQGSDGKYYTQKEMRDIITYAAERGIRIVPEFDLPGHSKSWIVGYPELASTAGPFKLKSSDGQLFSVPMNPTKDLVYEFINTFLGEMAELFPDAYMHIGGDEVNPKAWNESKDIQAFMKKADMRNAHDLQMSFNFKINDILKSHGKRMMGWEEVLHPDLGKDVVIQSWKSQRTLFEAAQRGSSAILSAGYYLDYKLPAGKHYQVDPWVLPGAVDIEPDTTHWKMFNTTMSLPGGEMESQLVLFDRDPKNVFGYFILMDQMTSFKNGNINGSNLMLTLNMEVGKVEYNARMEGDSLSGSLAFGLLKFDTQGFRIGGSDRPGTPLPKVEVIKPLTEIEKENILGGEAAMWTEVVSAENIDSRLWPRSAAIAERLWSPASLTNDVEDMYRRLQFIDDHLTRQGSLHNVNYEIMIMQLVPTEGYESLKALVDVLEEVKYLNRLGSLLSSGQNLYLPDLLLNGVADAAKPESLPARKFNSLVNAFKEDPQYQINKNEIVTSLNKWKAIHNTLAPYIEESDKLKLVQNIILEFSVVANTALEVINGKVLSESESAQANKSLDYLEKGDGGVLLAVAPGLRQLLK